MLEHLEPIPQIEEKSIKDLVKKFCEIKELPMPILPPPMPHVDVPALKGLVQKKLDLMDLSYAQRSEPEIKERINDFSHQIAPLVIHKATWIVNFIKMLPNGAWNESRLFSIDDDCFTQVREFQDFLKRAEKSKQVDLTDSLKFYSVNASRFSFRYVMTEDFDECPHSEYISIPHAFIYNNDQKSLEIDILDCARRVIAKHNGSLLAKFARNNECNAYIESLIKERANSNV